MTAVRIARYSGSSAYNTGIGSFRSIVSKHPDKGDATGDSIGIDRITGQIDWVDGSVMCSINTMRQLMCNDVTNKFFFCVGKGGVHVSSVGLVVLVYLANFIKIKPH